MCIIVEFRLLVLDSLKYNSKAESPIIRSTKAVISRNLTTIRHSHIFIYKLFEGVEEKADLVSKGFNKNRKTAIFE